MGLPEDKELSARFSGDIELRVNVLLTRPRCLPGKLRFGQPKARKRSRTMCCCHKSRKIHGSMIGPRNVVYIEKKRRQITDL